jgi:2-iminobutanoate/2-iminopropanoate deaminase
MCRVGMMVFALALTALLAGCERQESERRHITLPERGVAAPFSEAVLIGDTLYIAGQLGLEPDSGMPPDDPLEEARLLLESFREVLAAADMTMGDLVSVQVYCSDVALYDTWNEVYREFVPEPYPARAFIGSGPLLFGARFEMHGIAIRK